MLTNTLQKWHRVSIPGLLLLLIPVLSVEANDGPEVQTGSIEGVVVDIESGNPVSHAYVHLHEVNRSSSTDRRGEFTFRNLPSGNYTLMIHRIGFVTQNRTVAVSQGDTIEVQIELRPSVLSGQTVEIVAGGESILGSNMEHSSIKITGDQLRRELGVTLSETLRNQPGFTERSMGPAPGRPVMRGLGDQRLLILEDGQRSGDVSWTSADHSVSIDPASADELEIARGPAALEHGSNAIGGVINVVNNRIPNSIPGRAGGVASLQGTSSNNGMMATGSVIVPYNDFAWNLEASGRIGQNFATPAGTIDNTDVRTGSASLGGSYIRPWGYAGLSGSLYSSRYGIPPDPVAGHAEGVDIEMIKLQIDGRSEVLFDDRFFNILEIRGGFTAYNHREIEASGAVGTEYTMFTSSGSAKLRHDEFLFFDSGVVGHWTEFTDYQVFASNTPHSESLHSSLFAIQERDIGALHIESGVRLDAHWARPKQEVADDPVLGHIRDRRFFALTSSAAAIYDVGRGWHLGATLIHSFRPPSLEELYSRGPHLAAYSYEIGNPGLSPERGLGKELFVRFNADFASLELSGYHNGFSNFLLVQDTGEPNHRFPGLNNWQYTGTHASMYGVDLSGELEVVRNLVADASWSFIFGDRRVTEEEKALTGLEDSRQPLVQMPPARVQFGLRYSRSGFNVGGRLRWANRQDRTGEFEEPTEGYILMNLNTQYRFDGFGMFHTLTLNVENLLNTEHYNHLSRIKHLFPEPGRNVQLLYRVYF